MINKISHSQIAMYTLCNRKYYYHYKERLRSKVTTGALLFGSSMDHALNRLVKTRNLEESLGLFEKSWRYQNINNEGVYLPTAMNVVYAAKDFDYELLDEKDHETYKDIKIRRGFHPTGIPLLDEYKIVENKKKEQGVTSFTQEEQLTYSICNWLCLRQKGLYMIKSYNEQVLPKIKNVLAIQKPISLENNDGDEITGYLDLIVEWEDGKRYLLDHKTSSIHYESDSAMQSQQLVLYYHASKEEYKLDGVGFIVMYKTLDKNKVKICSICKNDGSGKRHKTCDNEIDKKRCNGEWIVSISPEAKIDIILNAVPKATEDLIISVFDEANEGIKKESFGPNLGACYAFGNPCPYLKKCWKGSDEDLIQLGKKE